MRQRLKTVSLVLGLLFFASLSASANISPPLDDEQALNVEANSFSYDHQTGLATYFGEVQAIQGTRQLQAEKLTIQRDQNGTLQTLIANGHPATIQFIPESGEVIYGQALQIEFHQQENLLLLIDSAQLQQQQDSYSAPRIEYNTLTQTIRSPQNTGGRTQIILQPRKKS